ncbi:MAG: sigma 54-interacting transcriptional regulator [Deltaproteobacteria bacterium]|nr:sigma 54-interacting transcriptional regulator [Deltaproteobacteria bacterium]
MYPIIFDSIHEGVFTVDSEFRITSFNRAAERITGTRRSAAIGRKCYEVFRANICQSECALKRSLRTGQPVRAARIDILDAAKRTVPIEVSTAVLRDRGKLMGGVEIFRDISQEEALRHELRNQHAFGDIIGASPPMQEVFRTLPDIAASDAPVLVEGPSGTGKELVARALHNLSRRKERPFVQVNCGALPDTLLESELFGYAKGAFTDAKKDKPGRFLIADKGTLLLDEVGDISPAFQVKLLRVLQEGEFTPLGGTRSVRVDVRLITATNRDLAEMVRRGTFREDLYYRIRVVPISLPPLRERRSDIPLLVDHFVRKLAAKTGKPIREVSAAAMDVLCSHDFPGNVRELDNVLQRAFVLCHGTRIEAMHLPGEWATPPKASAGKGAARKARPSSRDDADVDSGSGEAVLRAELERHRWDRGETAAALGIGRTTLWRRMKRLGIPG